MTTWLLPESVADVLPTEARKIEDIRRLILDKFQSYGYELVVPPLIEFEESLLLGSQKDLSHLTFKLIDQMSGRSLGVRADMTPQVTRIDAHLLNREGVTRLCYFGSVLHTRPGGLFQSREPFQMGAELYGHAGQESEIEMIHLALDSLQSINLNAVLVDLNHSAVIHALLSEVVLPTNVTTDDLLLYLRRKDHAELRKWVAWIENPAIANAILTLPELSGGVEVLAQARKKLPSLPTITTAIDRLEKLAQTLSPFAEVGIDFSDVPSYAYHSGITFSMYHAQYPNAILRGGRYDHMGATYGRARHAVGFSFDLKVMASLLPAVPPLSAISAPFAADADLYQLISRLRAEGEIVVQSFAHSNNEHQEYVFDRQIIASESGWIVQKMSIEK